MKAVVYTLGCKVNDVESGSIIRGLETLGYQVTKEMQPADLYVLNTCAVTAEAERKSRQTLGKMVSKSGGSPIIVCGCASQKAPLSFLQKQGNVVCVFGAKQKNAVLECVKKGLELGWENVKAGGQVCVQTPDTLPYEEMPTPHVLKTRNFVKIQDGCNRFCSYCIIPYLRGRSRSRSATSAAKEIWQSTAYETVIAGIDLSTYRDDEGNDIADLLQMVKGAPTRIRLGSIEVSMITEKLLSVLKEMPNFAPHFHLSLQSGSTAVLKSMNRHYTREEYIEKCKRIYEAFENAAITTDIIVGFPTETEEDFLLSLAMVKEVGFSQIHAFPYSPREGTNAYKKYKELSADIKKERVARILEEGALAKNAYLQKQIGRTLCVVPERYENGYTEGYGENYVRVYVQGDAFDEPVFATVQGLYKDGVWAKACEK